jgi:hypothetical protein
MVAQQLNDALQKFRHGEARRWRQAREIGSHWGKLVGWGREEDNLRECLFLSPQTLVCEKHPVQPAFHPGLEHGAGIARTLRRGLLSPLWHNIAEEPRT